VDGPVNRLTPHRIVNPEGLEPPVGFSHAVVAAPGQTVHLAGQTGRRADGTLAGEGLLEQFDQACANVVEALTSAGGRPEHLVSMLIYVTEVEEYRQVRREVGTIYRKHFGAHYPAAALLEVKGLFDPDAKVELVCVAVVTPYPL
jgi:enamine deaminase RidA (YjgF/YER057c/UK114 family)